MLKSIMSGPFLFLILSLFLIAPNETSAQTPTENLLTQVSENEIAEVIALDELGIGNSFNFNLYADFFHQIIVQENENLIGYHATTVDHYIFQEFVRAILEIRHEWKIPEDFYFLRVPGEKEFNIKGVTEISNRFGRPEFNAAQLKDVVFALIDGPIHKLSGQHLNWENINDEKIKQLYDLFLHFTSNMPIENMSRVAATAELMRMLKEMVPLDISEGRIVDLQKAIVRFAKNPRADKFRETYPAWLPFERINFPFDDTDEELQSLIISLNIPLYGNFQIASESTIHIFANNMSVEIDNDEDDANDVSYESFFKDRADGFFNGINSKQVKEIFDWAKGNLSTKTGIILQFTINHSEYSSELENIFYPCGFFGVPLKGSSVKENIQNGKGDWIVFPHSHKPFLINNQPRLVLTNEFSLNPFSGLKIKQHDLIDPASKLELRQRIRAVVSNPQLN